MYKFNKKEDTNIEKGSSASIFHASHFVKALIVELLQLQQNKTAKCDPYYPQHAYENYGIFLLCFDGDQDLECDPYQWIFKST